MIFNGKGGQWAVTDSKTLVIRFGNKDRTLKFNDNGSEAVLINPIKNPPSRMRPQAAGSAGFGGGNNMFGNASLG